MWRPHTILSIAVVYFFVGIVHSYTERRLRQTRQTEITPEYYLDILILTDRAVYKAWLNRTNLSNASQGRNEALQNIRRYFALVIKEVSDLYRSLKADFVLTVRPVGFYIVEDENEVSWTQKNPDGLVNSSQVLEKLTHWLRINGTAANLSKYDHAMLFTGEDLATDHDENTAGRANVGTMCKGDNYNSVSVVEDRGAFQSVFIAAHELGHSLNASHDGIDNNCSTTDRYIMAASSYDVTNANRRQPWFFSSCTSAEIQRYIHDRLQDRLLLNCLTTAQPTSLNVPNVTDIVPGQLYTADIYCQHLYGPQSYFCFVGNLSTICSEMLCKNPTDNQCYGYFAASGTSCGNEKWCQAGECLQSQFAPPVNSCFKDNTDDTVDGRTCKELATNEPQLCYDPEVYENCCASCNEIFSGNKDCPYGDKKRGCTSALCYKISSNGEIRDEDCCSTCMFDRSNWECADASEVDSMSCSTALKRTYSTGCYNESLAYYCCQTCQNWRNPSKGAGCEYGDMLPDLCPVSATGQSIRYGGECSHMFCCETCSSETGSGNPVLPTILMVLITIFVVKLYTSLTLDCNYISFS